MVAVLEGGIRAYENRMETTMPWIYGLIPPTTDKAAQEEFLAKLGVIQNREIVLEEEWHAFATAVWTTQI